MAQQPVIKARVQAVLPVYPPALHGPTPSPAGVMLPSGPELASTSTCSAFPPLLTSNLLGDLQVAQRPAIRATLRHVFALSNPLPPCRSDAADWPGGGVNEYLQRLRSEVIPWVTSRYPVASDPAGMAFGGSSFGGIAALVAGMQGEEGCTFGALLVESPSMWIGEEAFLKVGGEPCHGQWVNHDTVPDSRNHCRTRLVSHNSVSGTLHPHSL